MAHGIAQAHRGEIPYRCAHIADETTRYVVHFVVFFGMCLNWQSFLLEKVV